MDDFFEWYLATEQYKDDADDDIEPSTGDECGKENAVIVADKALLRARH